MSFKVLIDKQDGTPYEVIYDVGDDKRVTRVSVCTSNGEAAGVRVEHTQDEILLRFETVMQDGRPTLQDVEAARTRTLTGEEVDARVADLATLPSATNEGGSPMMTASQLAADESDLSVPADEEDEVEVDEEVVGEQPDARESENQVDKEPPPFVEATPNPANESETSSDNEPPADAGNLNVQL